MDTNDEVATQSSPAVSARDRKHSRRWLWIFFVLLGAAMLFALMSIRLPNALFSVPGHHPSCQILINSDGSASAPYGYIEGTYCARTAADVARDERLESGRVLFMSLVAASIACIVACAIIAVGFLLRKYRHLRRQPATPQPDEVR